MQINHKKIKFLQIAVTVNCPLRCKMCFNWMNNEKNEIEGKYLKKSIDDLYKNNLFSEDASVIFAGAEALLREDVFDLVKFAGKRGLRMVVGTSGYIYNEDISSKFINSGLQCIALPLDSLDQNKHDYLRGVNGVFQNTMKIIREHPKKVALTCTISAYNIDEICEIAEWIQSNDDIGLLGYQAIVAPFNGRVQRRDWFADTNFSHLWPKDLSVVSANLNKLIKFCNTSTKIYTTIKHLSFFKEYFKNPNQINREVKCKIGDYSLTIMNKGDVVFCNYLQPLGNIKENNIIPQKSVK